MKISELVQKLQEIQKQHGDLPVWSNRDYYASEVDKVSVKRMCDILDCIQYEEIILVHLEPGE